jgi:hypothetical protein
MTGVAVYCTAADGEAGKVVAALARIVTIGASGVGFTGKVEQDAQNTMNTTRSITEYRFDIFSPLSFRQKHSFRPLDGYMDLHRAAQRH